MTELEVWYKFERDAHNVYLVHAYYRDRMNVSYPSTLSSISASGNESVISWSNREELLGAQHIKNEDVNRLLQTHLLQNASTVVICTFSDYTIERERGLVRELLTLLETSTLKLVVADGMHTCNIDLPTFLKRELQRRNAI